MAQQNLPGGTSDLAISTPPVFGEQRSQRRLRIYPRSNTKLQIDSAPSADRLQQVTTIGPGVIIRVDGLNAPEVGASGPLEIAADRIVIWTRVGEVPSFGGETVQNGDAPLEFYMEGNIVFRQSERVVYAHSMYYDYRARNGIVYEAEMLTPVEKHGSVEYEGLVRVKADVLRQLNAENFVAHGAAITSSRLGVPRYWFQTETATLEDRSSPRTDPTTGLPAVDPLTGRLQLDRRFQTISRGNLIYLLGKPIFYWPVIATDLMKPSFYLDRISFKNDSVFGTQILTDWDMYQLLGIVDPPDGTRWRSSLDYLSDRGLGGGTNFIYERNRFWRWDGPVGGELDIWGLHDDGFDNLGADRRTSGAREKYSRQGVLAAPAKVVKRTAGHR